MREILFRGKRTDNGEWVNGYYVYDYAHNAHYIFKNQLVCPNCINDRRIDYSMCDYEIDPKTLCQYTELKDKNGNRIWENDIVKVYVHGQTTLCKVSWADAVGHFQLWQVNTLPNTPSALNLGNYIDEVVGNRFDTPELLKGE